VTPCRPPRGSGKVGALATGGRPARTGASRAGHGPRARARRPRARKPWRSRCRLPGGYLRQHYRRGAGAAYRLGAGHGVFCVGCCWALMLVAFAAGVANLWWMAALTAVMVFEKTDLAGRRAVRPVGLGLIALGLLMLAGATLP
jgi:hypothetical protein